MKYGQVFQEQSVPQWSPYNVDYDELKLLIKRNTTRQSGQAMTVPGQIDTGLEKFELEFYEELCMQHDRVDLFVRSKADELRRRLHDLKKKTINLIAKSNFEQRKSIPSRRMEKLSRLESKVLERGDDIKNLERFVAAQKTAFRKILKKYKKWTGSTTLSSRFTEGVLGNPKSFTHFDFGPLRTQFNTILTLIQQTTPPQSGFSTPSAPSPQASRPDLRRQIEVIQIPQQSYWNEYDNGSEAGDANEPYTIFIDPLAETTFPGAKSVIYIINALSSRAKIPIEKVKGWFSPQSSPEERRPLTASGNTGYFGTQLNSPPETDVDDDVSSSDFPNGYDAHYATFPSIEDQKLTRNREKLLFQATVGSFLAAFLLLIISGILVATGRHRLRVEVDAGVIVGVVASLLFATLGFTTMAYRYSRIGWFQRSTVAISFLLISIFSGALLVLVMGNTSL